MRLKFAAVGIVLLGLFVSGCSKGPQRPEDSSPLVPAEQLAETDLLPYLDAPIKPDRNCVYCATFQIAWDELRENLSGEPVALKEEPELAAILNQNTFEPSNLSPGSFLAMSGRTDQDIVDKIRKALSTKFPKATLQVPDPPKKTVIYT